MIGWKRLATLWLAVAVIWGPMMMPPSHWYKSNVIRIDDSVRGTPPDMYVERGVYRTFTGTYSVRIHTFPGNELVCVAGPYGPFPYTPSTDPLRNKDLAWWLRDMKAFNDCEDQGMVDGTFIAYTQHTILRPWWFVPWVREIRTPEVPSNAFRMFPTGESPIDQLQMQQRQLEGITEELNRLQRGYLHGLDEM